MRTSGIFSRSSEGTRDSDSLPPADSGRIPVMYSWFMVVMPCLLICYAGQVAYMLEHGVPVRANTFYAITPRTDIDWLDQCIRVADMSIAAIAAIIASQALITGMFSIVKQATALGFVPRFRVFHTDSHGEGQVYIPAINWMLFLGCVFVTLVFRSSGNLAAAYGVAVTGTMGITTIIFSYVTYYRWKWKLYWVLMLGIPILCVDLLFFASNLLKTWKWRLRSSSNCGCVNYRHDFVAMGRRQLATAFYDFGVREGKKIEWLVSLRDMLDDLELTLQENLPAARQLIQGRRRPGLRAIERRFFYARAPSIRRTILCRWF